MSDPNLCWGQTATRQLRHVVTAALLFASRPGRQDLTQATFRILGLDPELSTDDGVHSCIGVDAEWIHRVEQIDRGIVLDAIIGKRGVCRVAVLVSLRETRGEAIRGHGFQFCAAPTITRLLDAGHIRIARPHSLPVVREDLFARWCLALGIQILRFAISHTETVKARATSLYDVAHAFIRRSFRIGCLSECRAGQTYRAQSKNA